MNRIRFGDHGEKLFRGALGLCPRPRDFSGMTKKCLVEVKEGWYPDEKKKP